MERSINFWINVARQEKKVAQQLLDYTDKQLAGLYFSDYRCTRKAKEMKSRIEQSLKELGDKDYFIRDGVLYGICGLSRYRIAPLR